MSQKERILELLKANPDGVTCGEFAKQGLYHSLAKRVFELRGLGYNIQFTQHTDGIRMWDFAKYRLLGTSGNGIERSAEVPLIWNGEQAEMRI